MSEPVESLYKEADVAALEMLARATGGQLLAADRMTDVLKVFPSEALTETIRRIKPLWASWLILVPLVGAFSIEWYLRKRWNLV